MFYDSTTTYTDISVEKMREAFAAVQKLLAFFQQKILAFFLDINILNFNDTLINAVVNFESRAQIF